MLHAAPASLRATEGMFRIEKIFVLIVLVVAGAAIAWYSFDQRASSDRDFADEVQRARTEAHRIQSDVVFYTASVVPSRQSFAALLGSIGISPSAAGRAIASRNASSICGMLGQGIASPWAVR